MFEYYAPPPEKRVPCSLRLPQSLKDHLLAIVRLWRTIAANQGHDPERIDLTFVCERLLRTAVDAVWAQAGATIGHAGVPKSEESWDKIREALTHAVCELATAPLHRTRG